MFFVILAKAAIGKLKLYRYLNPLLKRGFRHCLNIPNSGNFPGFQKLQWSGAVEYRTASRSVWYVGKDVAGYVKKAGKLTEVMVRDAGHMVPADQPRWGLDLITRFFNDETFPNKPTPSKHSLQRLTWTRKKCCPTNSTAWTVVKVQLAGGLIWINLSLYRKRKAKKFLCVK